MGLFYGGLLMVGMVLVGYLFGVWVWGVLGIACYCFSACFFVIRAGVVQVIPLLLLLLVQLAILLHRPTNFSLNSLPLAYDLLL